jgi:hypothetical protein
MTGSFGGSLRKPPPVRLSCGPGGGQVAVSQPSVSRTCSTAWRCFAGLRSFLMRPHEGSPYPTRRLPGDPSTGRSPSRAPSVLSPRLHEAHLTPASSDSRSTPLPRACGPPRHGLPLSQTNLGLAELPNDLLLCELPPSWHCRPPLSCDHTRIRTPNVASFKDGRPGLRYRCLAPPK